MFDCTCLDKYGNTVTYLTQWDSNQTLYIEDHGFTTPPQFHFCNKNSENALVVQSTLNNGILEVSIPNILLIEPYSITAYVYLSEDNSNKTVEYIQLPVRERPKPDAFEYEENMEVLDLQELAAEIKALNDSIAYAEEQRIQSETIRIENENNRIATENARQSAETIRKSQEDSRIEAENVRSDNEDARNESETQRNANETLRENAENDRISAETLRENNETVRQTNEVNRQASEESRVNTEDSRVQAENARNDAEATREENEVIRQSQESDRQTNTATAIENANKATDRANLAAEACEGIVAGTGFISITEKGIPNGVATLDDAGKIPSEQLPNDIGGNVVPDGVTYIDFDSPTGEEVGDILPIDADTLGGHTVDYFATNDDLNTKADGLNYQNNVLSLMSGEETLSSVTILDLDASTLEGHDSIYFATAEDVNDIVSGTTQVGNAKTLDGHGAEYFFPKSGGTIEGGLVVRGPNFGLVSLKAEAVRSYLGNSLRSLMWIVGTDGSGGLFDNTNSKFLMQFSTDGNTNTWNGTASGNLPLNGGGDINGHITIKSDGAENRLIYLQNSLRCVYQKVFNTGAYELYDKTNSKPIISSSADGQTTTFNGTATGNLPLSGGTVNGSIAISYSGGTMFYLIAKESNSAFMQFRGKDGTLGYLGFNGANAPTLLNNSGGTLGTLLHTGNKPTGTYTGNGDATSRTISTGGMGSTLKIVGNGYAAIITNNGGFLLDSSGTVSGIKKSEVSFENGILTIASASAGINASSPTYWYEVL